jgi:hypothetical protein
MTFRINFYSYENGLPDKRIIEKSILEKKSLTYQEWLTFDIDKYNIYLKDDFVVGIEMMPSKRIEQNYNRGIFIGEKLLGSNSFKRNSSLGLWENFDGIAPTLYVTVKQ